MSSQMVSMKTIAQACGISTAAVSLALSGKTGRISAEMRKKVLECAEKMHYHGNPAARTLRRKRTDQITLVLPPFFSEVPNNLDFNAHVRQMHWKMIFGVISHAAAAGYDVKLLPVTKGQNPEELIPRLDHTHTDGVIFFSGKYFRSIFSELNVPKVAAEMTGMFEESDVDVDPFPGFRQALEYLTVTGEKKIDRIGYAAPLSGMSLNNRTLEYVEKVLAEKHLTLFRSFDVPDDFTVLSLAQTGAFGEVGAVFCGNDAIAARLSRSCRFCRTKEPVIIGYDDNPVWHDLPTIGIDRDRFSAAAVTQLLTAMEGKKISRIQIPTRFLKRSTKEMV